MQKFSRENLRIKTFKLALRRTGLLLGCKVDEWLEIAVRNQVAEIELQGPVNYKLPRFLFRAKSLRSLRWTNLEIPYYEAVDLVSLERLALYRVVVGERMLLHIFNSCPLLKDLRLSNCSGFKNIVIPCRSKLEDFFIEGDLPIDGKVILETSSLRSFEYIPDNENNPWPIISSRGLLRSLRFLYVDHLSITDEVLAELLPELASLEKLEFSDCDTLTSIKISHTQLKQICLVDCDNLLNVVIDAPTLTKFKFHGELDPRLSITIRSQTNCNIDIHSYAWYFKTDAFFKLKKLLKGLNSCDVLKILFIDGSSESTDDDIKFDEEESGNAELGPPCDIRELKLDLYSYWELSSSSLSAFLNGLFWTCRPPVISLRVDSGCRKLTVESLLSKLMNMVKCLRHPLKRIEVEDTNNDSDFLKSRKVKVQLKLYW